VHLEHLNPNTIPVPDLVPVVPVLVPVPLRPGEGEEGSDVTSSRTPYHMIPIVQQEKADREALGITPRDYGTRWQSAYRAEIGEMPECGPGDHDKAESYWLKICRALEMQEGDRGCWTPAENNRLHMLERKWRARKDGLDPWFEMKGTWKGRLAGEEREKFEELRAMMEINKRSLVKR
jgi:hypothetical protein